MGMKIDQLKPAYMDNTSAIHSLFTEGEICVAEHLCVIKMQLCNHVIRLITNWSGEIHMVVVLVANILLSTVAS